MSRMNQSIWYAVQETTEDDWSYGSYDYDEAIEMLKKQGYGLIAVIHQDTCISENYYEEYFG